MNDTTLSLLDPQRKYWRLHPGGRDARIRRRGSPECLLVPVARVVLVSWVLLVLLGGLTACKGAPDFPTDAELRLTFHDKHGVFERLLAMLNEDDADGYMCVIRMHGPRKAEYEALMHEIGVKAISCSRNRDYVRFLVAEYAHFGFHHDEKGFVYDPKPHEMLVVEELPASACGGRSGRWNPWWTRSRLDAHWYIYWTHED